jgi:hypothetical protein
MTCSRCRKKLQQDQERCPHCGQPARFKGTFQTSTVLISAGGEDLVYRSVDEVPPRLRSRLMRSTSSGNSGTILIADRRGRKEIARAMRKTTAPASGFAAWLTSRRRRAILVVLFLCCLALIGAVFTHRW